MFPSRALERAVVRAARAELGVTMLVAGLTESTPALTDLAEGLAEHTLVVLLEGPDGTQGMAALSPGLLAAVLGVLMTGQMPDPLPDPRAPTRIDADMMRGLVDRLLQEFAGLLAGQEDGAWAQGYRFGAQLPDGRFLKFSLPDVAYRGFDLQLEIGGGPGLGLRLVVPAHVPGAQAAQERAKAGHSAGARRNLCSAPLTLEAVLARVQLPVAQVSGWKVGDMLPLSVSMIDAVQLEVPGGAVAATGRLGCSSGDRAVRIAQVAGAGMGPPAGANELAAE